MQYKALAKSGFKISSLYQIERLVADCIFIMFKSLNKKLVNPKKLQVHLRPNLYDLLFSVEDNSVFKHVSSTVS